MSGAGRPPGGHTYRIDRIRGPAWHVKHRLPDGHQVQKRLGPAWSDRGRPAAGYFTTRQAEDVLRDLLHEARRGTLPGMTRTGATFAEFLRYSEHERACKPSTLRDYRSNLDHHLLPAFSLLALESLTPELIETWRQSLTGISSRTRNKLLTVLGGIMGRAQSVWGLQVNPVAGVRKHRSRTSGEIDVFSLKEAMALVRAARSKQDAAVFLTAAFTGMDRGEMLALRWREVDFAASAVRVRASFAASALTTLKSGKVRSVPLAPDVAEVLAQLGQREHWIAEDASSFAAKPAADSTARRCAAGMRWPWPAPGFVHSASTTCATPSAPG